VAKRQGGKESSAKQDPCHFTTLPVYRFTTLPYKGSVMENITLIDVVVYVKQLYLSFWLILDWFIVCKFV